MAQQKKKTTTTKKKTTGSSRSSSSGKRTAKKNQKRPIRREVAGAILLVLALCLGFSYFQSGAWLLDQPAKLCRSLFGWGYYLVAPALLLGSYILLFHRGRNVVSCLVGTALLPVVFGAIMHIALCKEEYVNMDGILKLLWTSGNALESGGAVSASLAIMLVLLVPTMVIVHIRSKVLERAIEWVATLPLTIPAIVLVVGLGPIYRWLSADVLSTNPIWLCFAYVILVMPFAFRAITVGLNSIDVKTLVEASRSLGASWPKVFFKVIIPNLWQSILSASFISIAVVLGEYTVASLLGRMNLQVALYQLGQSNSQISTAMSLLALLFGAVLLVALDLISDAMRKSREGK